MTLPDGLPELSPPIPIGRSVGSNLSHSVKALGFTFVELLVVMGILVLIVSVAVLHFRNTGQAASQTTAAIAFQMEGRRLHNRLHETIVVGTEVVNPPEGSSAGYVVFRDLVNRLRVLYLETSPDPKKGPYRLVTYLDDLSGAHRPENRQILMENLKEGTFTTLAPGMVLAHLVLVSQEGQELSVLVQVPLKNIGSQDDD
jgi:type II secretory pathway pseudopilin PulG